MPGTTAASTLQPSSVSRVSTQAAARKYAGDVPGRGPISPARWRTARIAVPTRTSAGSTRSGRAGSGGGVSGGVLVSALGEELVGLGGVEEAVSGDASSAVQPDDIPDSSTAHTTAEATRTPRR